MIPQIASELRGYANKHAIARGLSEVEKAKSEIDALSMPDTNSIRVLCDVAIWLDFDLGLRGWVEGALKRWPAELRGVRLIYVDGLLLRFVESTVWLHKEEYDEAIQGFCEIIAAKDVLGDDFLYFFANYYAARCQYYKLRYDDAGKLLNEARSQADKLEEPALQTAVLDILESRILIKRRPLKEIAGEAIRFLRRALASLETTDDYLTRANINTFLAKIAADAPLLGEDAAALLDTAVAEVEKHQREGQPAAGRAYLSHGYEKLGQACELQEQLQVAVPVKRKDHLFTAVVELWPQLKKTLGTAPALVDPLDKIVHQMQSILDNEAGADYRRPVPEIKQAMRSFQDEALADAHKAIAIFERLGHRRNLANAHLLIGSCTLARCEYDSASKAVEQALECARGNDLAVESRAWSLAAEIACARSEDDPYSGKCAMEARKCAEKAMQYADKADPRTQGIANCVAGLALLLGENPTVEDWKRAGNYRDSVRAILRKFPEPSLRRRLEALQAKLVSERGAAGTLANFARTGEGPGLDALEASITEIVWKLTGTVANFQKKLGIKRHKAENLLQNAGIEFRPIRKIPKCQQGKKPVAVQTRKLENAS